MNFVYKEIRFCANFALPLGPKIIHFDIKLHKIFVNRGGQMLEYQFT